MDAKFPPFQWGTSYLPNENLEVEDLGHCLRVVGFNPFSALHMRPELHSWDAFETYRKAPKDWSKGRTGKSSPHIQFANADTDSKLIAFVRQFGPVTASSVSEESPKPQKEAPPIRNARQDWDELRNERLLYQSMLTLISELAQERRGDVLRRCIATIADKVSDWPRQWRRELALRNQDKPDWQFDEETLTRVRSFKFWSERPAFGERIARITNPRARAIHAGHDVICELLNAFRPLVYRWQNSTIEGPDWDLRYGIRPILYFILRREYLQGAGVAVCANTQCQELFQIERAGERFCSSECSRRQRQREYWRERGHRLRKKRVRATSTRLRRTR